LKSNYDTAFLKSGLMPRSTFLNLRKRSSF
jgi:hypothetical protein